MGYSNTLEPLSDEENYEFIKLTEEVGKAIKRRTEWLDKKMNEKSKLKVGDGIYCLDSLQRLGTVTDLYRYHQNKPEYDSFDCEYYYETQPNCIDNTSRQTSLHYGTKQQAIDESKRERKIT